MITKLDANITGKGEVKGFLFTRVYENEEGYIYNVDTGESNHFEVFFRKETPICLDFENRIYSENESKEIYPKSKDFGIWAWTVRSIDEGVKKLTTTEDNA